MVRPWGRSPGETHSTQKQAAPCHRWFNARLLELDGWVQTQLCLIAYMTSSVNSFLGKINTLSHCCEDNCVNTHKHLREPGMLQSFGQC